MIGGLKMEEVDLEVCQTTIVHEGKVNYVISELHGKNFADLLVLSKCLGDLSRVQIVVKRFVKKSCQDCKTYL